VKKDRKVLEEPPVAVPKKNYKKVLPYDLNSSFHNLSHKNDVSKDSLSRKALYQIEDEEESSIGN